MKIFLLFLFIHLLAYSVVRAADLPAVQNQAPAAGSILESESESTEGAQPAMTTDSNTGLSEVAVPSLGAEPSIRHQRDDCRDLLPQLEADYREIETRNRMLSSGSMSSQEAYLQSFQQVSQVLFKMVEDREQETSLISQSRDRLRQSMEQFNQYGTTEASRSLQNDYMDLTVRLYSTLIDSQKILETLKSQISQVESTRGQLEANRQELERLDHQKLALEGKLISLKIKCQTNRIRF